MFGFFAILVCLKIEQLGEINFVLIETVNIEV